MQYIEYIIPFIMIHTSNKITPLQNISGKNIKKKLAETFCVPNYVKK